MWGGGGGGGGGGSNLWVPGLGESVNDTALNRSPVCVLCVCVVCVCVCVCVVCVCVVCVCTIMYVLKDQATQTQNKNAEKDGLCLYTYLQAPHIAETMLS